MDTPPLSVGDLRASVEALRESLKAPDRRDLVSAEAVAGAWEEMEALAAREERSLFGISTAVAMFVADKARKTGLGLYGSVSAGFDLLDRAVLGYYKDGLRAIREKGYWRTVRDVYKPYSAAVSEAFKPSRRSFTERLCSGELPKKLLGRLRGRAR